MNNANAVQTSETATGSGFVKVKEQPRKGGGVLVTFTNEGKRISIAFLADGTPARPVDRKNFRAWRNAQLTAKKIGF